MVWKFIVDNWDIILMYRALFAGAVIVGWLAGWAIIQLIYNQRLAHQADMIVKLRAILEEKLPSSFLPQPKRSRPMSFALILGGIGLAFAGLAMATAGVFWQSPTQKTQQSRTPQISEDTPTKPSNSLLPNDGGAITWFPGQYIFGGGGDDKGVRVQSFQATGKNNSDQFIQPLSGYLRSEVTGKQYTILVNDNGTLVEAAGYGIPAGYQFNIGVRLVDAASGGMTTAELLRDFSRMTFVFNYGDKTYTKHFAPDEIEAEVLRMEHDLRPKPINGFAGVRRTSP